MEFSPFNPIVKLCIHGMAMEEKNMQQEASKFFMQALEEATNDFEKFIAAYFVARHQSSAADNLRWYEIALQHAIQADDAATKSAYPTLYNHVAQCYKELGDAELAAKNREQAFKYADNPVDNGPFYHGTKADLQVGDMLVAGFMSNYKDDLQMNHIYFTAIPSGAGLAAALSKGDGHERVYIVEPTGDFENDPNVTDKKFPGNLTRSYRTEAPLKIIGELTDWNAQMPEEINKWREKLDEGNGDIIN